MGETKGGKGQSSVLGVVLLFAIVLSASLLVVAAGSGALADARSATIDESAVNSMGELQSTIAQLESEGGTQTIGVAGTGSNFGAGATTVDETAGNINVTVRDASTGNQKTVTRNLGQVSYEGESDRLVYEGGGLFRVSSDGGTPTVVSPPAFEYQYRAGSQTLRLSFTTLETAGSNAQASLDGDIAVNQSASDSAFPGGAMQNPLEEGDSVQVTVESETYEAWAAVFERRTEGTVTTGDFDGDGQMAARVELVGPRDRSPMSNGAVLTSVTLRGSNNVVVDSYDSSNGIGPSPGGGSNAPMYVHGIFEATNNMSHSGPLIVENRAEFNGRPVERETFGGKVVTGAGSTALPARSTKKTSVDGNSLFNDTFSTKDDLEVRGKSNGPGKRAVFKDDVYVGGNVSEFKFVDVEGDLYVQGNVTLNEHVDIDGNITADGTVSGETNTDVSYNSITENGDPPEPFEPQLPPMQSFDSEITATGAALSADNDNSDYASEIPIIQNSSSCTPCTLTASSGGSEYYFDNITLSSSETLRLNTEDGPMTIYIDGSSSYSLSAKGSSQIVVRGDNPVRIYNNRSAFFQGSSKVMTENASGDKTYRAPNVQLYLKSGEEVRLTDSTTFTGAVRGSDTTRVDIANSPTIYGGISGEVSGISEDSTIHFDESLLNTGPPAPGAMGDAGRVTYLSVTARNVTVDDE